MYLSKALFSGSTSFLKDCSGNLTGEAIPPVLEFGVGAGTPLQLTMTGNSTGIYGRNNVLGDFGRWLGRTIFDVTH